MGLLSRALVVLPNVQASTTGLACLLRRQYAATRWPPLVHTSSTNITGPDGVRTMRYALSKCFGSQGPPSRDFCWTSPKTSADTTFSWPSPFAAIFSANSSVLNPGVVEAMMCEFGIGTRVASRVIDAQSSGRVPEGVALRTPTHWTDRTGASSRRV